LLLVLVMALPLTAVLKGKPWAALAPVYGEAANIPVATAVVLGRWAGEQVQQLGAGICQSAGTAWG
jgi:hypothetical protein